MSILGKGGKGKGLKKEEKGRASQISVEVKRVWLRQKWQSTRGGRPGEGTAGTAQCFFGREGEFKFLLKIEVSLGQGRGQVKEDERLQFLDGFHERLKGFWWPPGPKLG